jgi:preprotein translocase subunit Sec63
MSFWEFAVIMGCGVAGFWLVSIAIDAFSSKVRPSIDPIDAGRSSERPREPTWFEVLGVKPTATIDEIKNAYRERALQYHPDRVQGLGQEFQDIADRKMRELNLAYQSALHAR